MENTFAVNENMIKNTIFNGIIIDYTNNKMNNYFRQYVTESYTDFLSFKDMYMDYITDFFNCNGYYINIYFYIDRADIEIDDKVFTDEDTFYYVDEFGEDKYMSTEDLYYDISNRLKTIISSLKRDKLPTCQPRMKQLDKSYLDMKAYWQYEEAWFDVYDEGLLEDRGYDVTKLTEREIERAHHKIKRDYLKYFRALRGNRKFISYILFIDKEKILSQVRIMKIKNKYYLEALATHKGYRNNGYAFDVLSYALRVAAINGATEVLSKIRSHNVASMNLHEKLGFRFAYREGNDRIYTYLLEDIDIVRALKETKNNIESLEEIQRCGCYHCQSIFSTKQLDKDSTNNNAVCPICGKESIIGTNAGFKLNYKLLEFMNSYWFFNEKRNKKIKHR